MRILHTADWHIGQTLNDWGREVEHRIWFEALSDLIVREDVDVMIVAGDIFDGINPSGEAQSLLYSSLRTFKDRQPRLRTVLTSGNHDPSGRLQAPAPILEGLDVHVVASLSRRGDDIDVTRIMIPLKDRQGKVVAQVCAIPFLRASDLPGLTFATSGGGEVGVVAAARRLHATIADEAFRIAGDVPIIAMGHLHCRGAAEDEGQSADRGILIGGEHALPSDVFPEVFSYVALGHIHRPQTLAGGRVRYCGSAFPLSAAEIGYDHGVTIIELEDGSLSHRHVSVPRPSGFHRIPETGAIRIEDLPAAIEAIARPELEPDQRPFVQVVIEATGPASVLQADAEDLILASAVRQAGCIVRSVARETEVKSERDVLSLAEIDPETLFRASFVKENGTEPEERHISAFRDALSAEEV